VRAHLTTSWASFGSDGFGWQKEIPCWLNQYAVAEGSPTSKHRTPPGWASIAAARPRSDPNPFHDDSALSGHSRNAFRSCSRLRTALRSSKTDVLGVQAPTYGDYPLNFLAGAGRQPSPTKCDSPAGAPPNRITIDEIDKTPAGRACVGVPTGHIC
jgi:hypothetical protein